MRSKLLAWLFFVAAAIAVPFSAKLAGLLAGTCVGCLVFRHYLARNTPSSGPQPAAGRQGR